MGRAILAVTALGVFLALGACDSGAEPPTAASPTKTTVTTAPPTTGPTPVVEKRTVTKKRKIPFQTRRVDDPTLVEGTTQVKRRGAAGVKALTYEVTLTNGVETGRKLLRKVITKAPINRVIAVGTKQARQCDSNYSGACVPIASDVDCEGGSGNGPAYVQGPVFIVGFDIYGLDSDGDGTACEP